METTTWTAILETVRAKAAEAGVFGEITLEDGVLSCAAPESAEPAFYRVFMDGGTAWVGLVTEDRWLSGSIEGDLVNLGDSLDELLDEEIADLGYDGPKPTFEHFRDEAKLYTFRSPLPFDTAPGDPAKIATQYLLGYEAVFCELGDMSESEEDD